MVTRPNDEGDSEIDGIQQPPKKRQCTPEKETSMFPLSFVSYALNAMSSKLESVYSWILSKSYSKTPHGLSPEEERRVEKEMEKILRKTTMSKNGVKSSDEQSEEEEEEEDELYTRGISFATPYYRDGTYIGSKRKTTHLDRHLKSRPKSSSRSSSSLNTPYYSVPSEIDILLDSASEITKDPKKMQKILELISDQPTSALAKSSSTKEEGTTTKHGEGNCSKSAGSSNGYCRNTDHTANELRRLKEKAEFDFIMQNELKTCFYGEKKPAAKPLIDLTEENSDESPLEPFSRYELARKVNQNYFCKNPYQPTPLSRTSEVKWKPLAKSTYEVKFKPAKIENSFPNFKPKTGLFAEEWLKELKEAVDSNDAHYKKITQQEDKLKRFQARRNAELERQKKLQEKFAFPKIEDDDDEEDLPVLTPDMNKLVDLALIGKYTKVIVKLTIDPVKSMASLKPTAWLDDEVIIGYLELIVERSRLDGYPSVFSFNTFLLNSLKKKGYEGVKRWNKRTDIFARDFIIIPLHFDTHWAIMIVDNRERVIIFYDSLFGIRDEVSLIRKFIFEEMAFKKDIELDDNEYPIRELHVPRQTNGSDCGVFICVFAEYFTRNAKLTFTQEMMPYFRRLMAYELIANELLPRG